MTAERDVTLSSSFHLPLQLGSISCAAHAAAYAAKPPPPPQKSLRSLWWPPSLPRPPLPFASSFCFFRVVEYAIISLRLLRSRLNHIVFREIRNSAGIIHSTAKFVNQSRPSVLSFISRENCLTSNVIKARLGVCLRFFSAEIHDNSS